MRILIILSFMLIQCGDQKDSELIQKPQACSEDQTAYLDEAGQPIQDPKQGKLNLTICEPSQTLDEQVEF